MIKPAVKRDTPAYLKLLDIFTKNVDQFTDANGDLIIDTGDGQYYKIVVGRVPRNESNEWGH